MATEGRIDKLRASLAEAGVDGAVIRRPPNVRYLTGLATGFLRPSMVVVSADQAVVVAPGKAEWAKAVVGAAFGVLGYDFPSYSVDKVADVDRLSGAALEAAIQQAKLKDKRIGIEETELSAFHAGIIARHGTTVPLAEPVQALRRIKDADEQKLFRQANAANDVGFEAARRAIKAGVTELEVGNAIIAAMQEASGVPIDILDDTNCLISGPRTRNAGGPPTTRRLERGDLMIVDINPFINSYKGDTTRTYSVGPPSAEQRRRYETAVRALEAGEKKARPGVSGRDVYNAMIEVIVGAGYREGLRGHGGHAIGLEHLERPYIIAGEDMKLAEGMTITLEPGFYLPDYGVRIEDNYIITASGAEVVSHYTRDLIVCDA